MRVKTASLIGEYVHVDSEDPAIDRSSDKWEHDYQIAMDTGDLSVLPLKNGSTEPPVLWRFRHLTTRELAWLSDSAARGMSTTMVNAVALALVGVTNVTDEKGKPVEVKRQRSLDLNGWQAVNEDILTSLLADEEGRPDSNRAIRLGTRIMADGIPRRG